MIKFLLDKLEQFVTEDILEEAEQLLALQTPKLTQVAPTLWVVNIVDADENEYEVEVSIHQKKVHNYTCECDFYHKKHSCCTHIAAVLLYFEREKHIKISASKPIKAIETPKNKDKFTLKTLLDQIKPEDLVSFVKEYARSDRRLVFALKTHFAAHIQTNNNVEKYSLLIRDAIKQAQSRSKKWTLASERQVLKTIKTLTTQANNHFLQAEYRECAIILQAILKQIAPISAMSDDLQLEVANAIFLFYQIVCVPTLAPVLREEIRIFSQEETKKKYYTPQLIQQICVLRTVLCDEIADKEELLSFLIQYVQTNTALDDALKANFLLLQSNLLENLQRSDEQYELLQLNINNPSILFFVLEKTVEQQDWQSAKKLITIKKPNDYPKEIAQRLEQYALLIAQQENNSTETKYWAQQCFLQQFDFKYYDVLKKVYGKSWTNYSPKLLEYLEKLPFSIEKRDAFAHILMREHHDEALLNYIQSMRSIQLLQRYDYLFFDKNANIIYDLYENLLKEYLQQHIGKPAALRVVEILTHLQQRNMPLWVARLIDMLRKTYPERTALMEDLGVFCDGTEPKKYFSMI